MESKTTSKFRNRFVIAIITTMIATLNSVIGEEMAGFFLYAKSPETVAEKVQCIEYERYEKLTDSYRFFLGTRGSVVVKTDTIRKIVKYQSHLTPSNIEYQTQLKSYEELTKTYPLSRQFLNPKILTMREKVAEILAKTEEPTAKTEVSIGGEKYSSPKYRKMENGSLVIFHTDGISKIDLAKITDQELANLVAADPSAASIKVIELFEQRMWNPSLNDITADEVKIKHEQGITSSPLISLKEKDKAIMDSWSDGSWKVAMPSFYEFNDGSYKELVLAGGKFHKNVIIETREKEDLILHCSGKKIKFPLYAIAKLPGHSEADKKRIEKWTTEILEERFAAATSGTKTELISTNDSEILKVTDVQAQILQVFDQGVLASKFVGVLHKGTRTVAYVKTVSAVHPITGETLEKEISREIVTENVVEEVQDDLCYIIGNTEDLTENSVVKIASMKLLGKHEYTDVLERPRSVRKYSVD